MLSAFCGVGLGVTRGVELEASVLVDVEIIIGVPVLPPVVGVDVSTCVVGVDVSTCVVGVDPSIVQEERVYRSYSWQTASSVTPC